MQKKKKSTKKTLKVAELFAGVGGFRIGLEKGMKRAPYQCEIIWSNQWEPTTNIQHASEVYTQKFGSKGHVCEDIANILTSNIPNHDLLVGGFPCQDYSVARTLSQAIGLNGKKGILWWQIHRILKEKGRFKPKYLLLENVDRLLKSPASQRGRDFAIMLTSLSDLGYAVEWRVINAADYGMPQRRKRVFIFGYKKGTKLYKRVSAGMKDPKKHLLNNSVFAKSFPVFRIEPSKTYNLFELKGNLADITDNFAIESPSLSLFRNSGFMINRKVVTEDLRPKYQGKQITLGDILEPEENISNEFFVPSTDLKKWKYQKNGKKEYRRSSNGFEYNYSEGSMKFPDPLDRPSRTIITGEGGPTPSRFKHIIKTPSGRYRRLTPVELERLCMFPDNHTVSQTPTKRAFFMGNALVVGVIKKLGKQLAIEIDKEERNIRD